jgi:hypothetical protein
MNKTAEQQQAHLLAVELSEAVRRYGLHHPQLSLHKLNDKTYLGWLENQQDIYKPRSEVTWIFPEIYGVESSIDFSPLTHEQAIQFIEFYQAL